jgi:alpha-galactosidase
MSRMRLSWRLATLVLLICAALTVTASAAEAATPSSYNGLAGEPPMGFNDWNAYGCGVSAGLIESAAKYMHTSGMQAAGYQYVNIDDCWLEPQRGADGQLVADPAKFPQGIPAVAQYVHSLGLKLGIYEDAGTSTCAGYPGSYGHEAADAATFASWGVDYLKYDQCNIPFANYPGLSHQQVDTQLYTTMSNALKATGRPIVFSMCSGTDPAADPWNGHPPAASFSNLWRTTTDIQDNFPSTLINFQGNVGLYPYAHAGAFNDPDMLEIGNGGQTATQYESQFSLWAEMAAPLIAGANLSALSRTDRSIYTNRAVIAVDQDRLGRQGHPVSQRKGLWVLTKPLAGGDHAVVLFNSTDAPATISTTARAVGAAGAKSYRLTDLWSGRQTRTAGQIAAFVPAQGTVMYRVRGVKSTAATVGPSTPLAITAKPQTVDTGQQVSVKLALTDDDRFGLGAGQLRLAVPKGWTLGSGQATHRFASLEAGHSVSAQLTLEAPTGATPLSTVSLRASAQFAALGGDGRASAVTPVTLSSPISAPYETVNATDEPARFAQHGSDFSIAAAGTGISGQTTTSSGTRPASEAFGAIVDPQTVKSSSVAQVTVTRQDGSTLRPFGTAGLLQRNTFSQPSSTEGVVLSVNTAGMIALQWNTGGGPFVNQTRLILAHAQLPVTLRLTRNGSSYVGDYSTDGGKTWNSAGTADVVASASAVVQDAGVFHASGVAGWRTQADFTGFSVR